MSSTTTSLHLLGNPGEGSVEGRLELERRVAGE
jgi:hypothetical protein